MDAVMPIKDRANCWEATSHILSSRAPTEAPQTNPPIIPTINSNAMAAFPSPSSVTPTLYLTNGTGLSPLLESVEAGGQIVSASCPVNDWYDAHGQATHPADDPFSDSDSFLALYDLCRGDVELLDRIRDAEHTSPIPPTPAIRPDPVAPLRVPTEEHPTPPRSSMSPSPMAVHPLLQDRRASRSASRVLSVPYSTAGKP
jgi:hypothetical protein